jgi:hypothetical protein
LLELVEPQFAERGEAEVLVEEAVLDHLLLQAHLVETGDVHD